MLQLLKPLPPTARAPHEDIYEVTSFSSVILVFDTFFFKIILPIYLFLAAPTFSS